MAKTKLLMGLLTATLLLTGCDSGSSSITSDGSDDSSEPTVKELFLEQGYAEITGWPINTIKALLSREDVSEQWVTSNLPTFNTGSATTKFYNRRYDEEKDLIIYKSYEFALPSDDETIISRYANQFNANTWEVIHEEDTNFYSIHTIDGDDKVSVGLIYLPESEFLPAATFFTVTVREKEEFPGASRPSEDAVRSLIGFGNTFKIVTRNQEEVVWDFQGFTFSVLQADSPFTVGNLPNNNGVGYLSNPLRVYEDQELVMSVGAEHKIEQLIFHTSLFYVDGAPVDPLAALPNPLEGSTIYIADTAIMYHFAEPVSEVVFKLTAETRFNDVIAIFSPL